MTDSSQKDQLPIRRPGQPPVDPKKLANFLEKLAECGNVTQAAELVDVSRTTLYRYRELNSEFSAAWDSAAEIGARALEDEARRRGFTGWDEPVYHQGEVVGHVRKHSDVLLIFLLKAHFPDKYRDRWKGELTGPGGGPIQTVNLHAVTGLSTEELRMLRDLLARAASRTGGNGSAPAAAP